MTQTNHSMPSKLAAALVAAQAKFPPIPKNRVAKIQTSKANYSYKYADLSDIRDAINPVLVAHKLFVSTPPAPHVDHKAGVCVVVAHESGESFTSEPFYMPVESSGPQATGSAMTYASRYAICATLGICADEDDDAHVAGGKGEPSAKSAPKSTPKPPTKATAGQVKQIELLASEKGSNPADICKFYSVNTLADLTSDQANDVAKKLASKKPAAKTEQKEKVAA